VDAMKDQDDIQGRQNKEWILRLLHEKAGAAGLDIAPVRWRDRPPELHSARLLTICRSTLVFEDFDLDELQRERDSRLAARWQAALDRLIQELSGTV
jgi:hypothetical protein